MSSPSLSITTIYTDLPIVTDIANISDFCNSEHNYNLHRSANRNGSGEAGTVTNNAYTDITRQRQKITQV